MSATRYPVPFDGLAVECVECGEVFPEVGMGFDCHGHIRRAEGAWWCGVEVHANEAAAVACYQRLHGVKRVRAGADDSVCRTCHRSARILDDIVPDRDAGLVPACSYLERPCELFLTESCVCGHLLRHHGVSEGHPGCYSPGCKCMAPVMKEDE